MKELNLVEFLVYVVPGFLAVSVFRSIHPAKKTDTFNLLAWSFVYSIWMFGIVRAIDAVFLNHSLHTNQNGFPSFRLIAALQVLGLAWGGGLAGIHAARRRIAIRWPKLSSMSPDPQSIWAKVNDSSNKDWAVVFLDDGAVYEGYISDFTFDPDSSDQDFLLSEAKRVDEYLKEVYAVNGKGVYLNTRHVRRIEFVR